MDIKDAVAVVTGGASGLGLATTKRLLDAGAQVVVLDIRGKEAVDELGDRATFVQTDVTDEAAVTAALETAESLGPLRIVVNCGDQIPYGSRNIAVSEAEAHLRRLVKLGQAEVRMGCGPTVYAATS